MGLTFLATRLNNLLSKYSSDAVEPAPAAEAAAEETKEEKVVSPCRHPFTEMISLITSKEEKPKEEKTLKPSKVARRLSARVGDFFKAKSKQEVSTPAKVDEHPPKIDEPEPVAPLENPASESASAAAPAPAEPAAATEEPPKPVEPVPAATPLVAAAA